MPLKGKIMKVKVLFEPTTDVMDQIRKGSANCSEKSPEFQKALTILTRHVAFWKNLTMEIDTDKETMTACRVEPSDIFKKGS